MNARTVLVVEPDPVLLELWVDMLEGESFRVLRARAAAAALACAEAHPGPVDLLLTDLALADADGFALASQLGERYPGLKVLYLAGHVDDRQGSLAHLRATGQPFVLKPFRRDELLRRIAELLDLPVDDDEFARLIAHPALKAVPTVGLGGPTRVRRATRFRVRMPVRYQWAGQPHWHSGIATNLSRSGVLLEIAPSDGAVINADQVIPGTPLEIVFEMPPAGQADPGAAVRCAGTFVRSQPVPGRSLLQAMAVRVDAYRE